MSRQHECITETGMLSVLLKDIVVMIYDTLEQQTFTPQHPKPQQTIHQLSRGIIVYIFDVKAYKDILQFLREQFRHRLVLRCTLVEAEKQQTSPVDPILFSSYLVQFLLSLLLSLNGFLQVLFYTGQLYNTDYLTLSKHLFMASRVQKHQSCKLKFLSQCKINQYCPSVI